MRILHQDVSVGLRHEGFVALTRGLGVELKNFLNLRGGAYRNYGTYESR